MNTERTNRFLGLFFMSARIGTLLSRFLVFLLTNSVHCLHRRTPVPICCISMRRYGGDNACPVITQYYVYHDAARLTIDVPSQAVFWTAHLHLCQFSFSAAVSGSALNRVGVARMYTGADFSDKGLVDVELQRNSLVKIPSSKSALIVSASTCILRFFLYVLPLCMLIPSHSCWVWCVLLPQSPFQLCGILLLRADLTHVTSLSFCRQ